MSDQSGSGADAPAPTDRVAFTMSDENIAELLRRVEAKAKAAEASAAGGGRQDDGGAGRIRAEAKAFIAGRSREDLPEGWWDLAMDIAREADPEFGEWQRLRGRFGG